MTDMSEIVLRSSTEVRDPWAEGQISGAKRCAAKGEILPILHPHTGILISVTVTEMIEKSGQKIAVCRDQAGETYALYVEGPQG